MVIEGFLSLYFYLQRFFTYPLHKFFQSLQNKKIKANTYSFLHLQVFWPIGEGFLAQFRSSNLLHNRVIFSFRWCQGRVLSVVLRMHRHRSEIFCLYCTGDQYLAPGWPQYRFRWLFWNLVLLFDICICLPSTKSSIISPYTYTIIISRLHFLLSSLLLLCAHAAIDSSSTTMLM